MSVPQIDDELAESLRILAELETRLPAIRTQAAQLQVVYDSGRQKVSVALCIYPSLRIAFLLTPFVVAARRKRSCRTYAG